MVSKGDFSWPSSKKLQNRQGGFIVSAELALITTIVVIGLIVGLVAVRDAMVGELHDLAESIGELNQSYVFAGLTDAGNGSTTQGSTFVDEEDAAPLTGGTTTLGNAGIGADNAGIDYLPPADTEGAPQTGTSIPVNQP